MPGADGEQMVFATPAQPRSCFEVVKGKPKFKVFFTENKLVR